MTTADIMGTEAPPDPGMVGYDGGNSLLPLMAWLSPSFPVGGYAYSHTLEWAVETGEVTDENSLIPWLDDLLTLGAGRSDAILLAETHRAARDPGAVADINALALALAPSAELHLETSQQGTSFIFAIRAAWPADGLRAPAGPVAYPVAVGLAAAAHRVPLAATLQAFLFGVVQNLVSAGVRLAPIGQTCGTRVLAALTPTIRTVAVEAQSLTLDDIGSCTFRADLGSFHHETQYTRLFRS